MKQNKRGVSLIVLVITIIVIIILAAAVILTINNNNPMDNANKARYTSDRANVQNALSTAVGKIAAEKQCSVSIPAQANIASGIRYHLAGASDGITKGKIGWETLATVSSGEEATTILGMKMPNYGSNTRWFVSSNGEVSVEVAGMIYGPGGTTQKPLQPGEEANGNTNYTVDGKTAVIPNGFYISKVKEEQSIDGGLVVVAPDASEFVWVPVDNVNDMFSGTPGNFAGMLTAYAKNGNAKGTPITPSSSEYREPDKLTNTTYGDTASNITKMNDKLKLASGKEVITGDDLQNFMQEDINAMYASIEKNKGFYIGRYETGDLKQAKVVSNKGNEEISGITWYEMYAKQKRFGGQLGTGVKSSMIYGSQWDAVMRWFAKDSNTLVYITNAENTEEYVKGNWSGTLEKTGYAGVKNIYDMAGNVWDWTAEAYSSTYRVLRGGSYSSSAVVQYASNRGSYLPTSSDSDFGSRLALYL